MGKKRPETIKHHKIPVIPYDPNTEANSPSPGTDPLRRSDYYTPPKVTKPKL